MKRLTVLLISFLLLIFFISGCQIQSASSVSITDDLGRQVQISKVPQKIVSLAPSNTELVYSLGLEDKLVGVTTWCNYPETAKSKPKVAEFSRVDVEKVISTGADLVLAGNIHKDTAIPALEKAGIPVLGIFPGTLDKLMQDITMIGDFTGKKQEANQLVSNLKNRTTAITDRTNRLPTTEKPRVLYLTWYDPLWTGGSNTMINDLIEKAGGINLASDLNGYQIIGLETVIQRNPQIIIVMAEMGSEGLTYQYVMNEARLKTTDAVKNGKVFKIDSDIFGRTTARTVDGLEQLAELFHPELFSGK